MVFVWKTPWPTSLRPVRSIEYVFPVFHTVGAKAPKAMFALTPGSSGAITLPPFDQVMPSVEVAYATRFLLESSPVYHIFQVVPSLRTLGSAALKLSAEPAGPCVSTASGSWPVPGYLTQETPSVDVA